MSDANERHEEVKTIRVKALCPNCKMGYMEQTGVVKMSFPPQYGHKCSNCGHGELYRKAYPYIDYEEVY